jgi:hypothetical protein
MGVTVENNKYRVRISKNGKRINIGTYATKKEAEQALRNYEWDNREQILLTDDMPQPRSQIITFTKDPNYKIGQHVKIKLTLRQRVKNAINSIRTSTGSKK